MSQIVSEMKFDVFIAGKDIDLVVLTEEIAEKSNWFNWFNDEENMRNSQKHYFPNTPAQQLGFFRNQVVGSTSKLQLGIFHKRDRTLIGMVSLTNIDFLNRKCEIGGLIGEKKYQNLKNFLEANRLIIRHAFEQLNMNKLYGGTMIKELSDIFVRILGFTYVGVTKGDVFKNGKYNDVYLIYLLLDDYRSKGDGTR